MTRKKRATLYMLKGLCTHSGIFDIFALNRMSYQCFSNPSWIQKWFAKRHVRLLFHKHKSNPLFDACNSSNLSLYKYLQRASLQKQTWWHCPSSRSVKPTKNFSIIGDSGKVCRNILHCNLPLIFNPSLQSTTFKTTSCINQQVFQTLLCRTK